MASRVRFPFITSLVLLYFHSLEQEQLSENIVNIIVWKNYYDWIQNKIPVMLLIITIFGKFS